MTENRNSRLKKALKDAKISQEKLGEALGISSQAVSERLNKDQDVDSIEFVTAVATLTDYRPEWLLTGSGAKRKTDIPQIGDGEVIHIGNVKEPRNQVRENEMDYMKGKIIRPITVVVDRSGKELIPYVAYRAQAGYTKGYGDSQYLEKLPAFALPIMKDNATYRMFEVHGDSMLQIGGGGLHDGDVVIAQYVEDFFAMRDNRVYVVVCESGVIVKRCLNRLKEKEPVLVCNSDNKNGNFKPIIVRPHEIIEVWELKSFISRQLSFSTDLWTMINDLQVQQARLAEKVEAIETKRLK
jgi:transcriptional regulator with XRE-family HTH domain